VHFTILLRHKQHNGNENFRPNFPWHTFQMSYLILQKSRVRDESRFALRRLNYSKTSYFLVKFPALSFKNRDDPTAPSSPKAKNGTFLSKKGVCNRIYLKICISDFLKILRKLTAIYGQQVTFQNVSFQNGG
jgi:hypothetical protein